LLIFLFKISSQGVAQKGEVRRFNNIQKCCQIWKVRSSPGKKTETGIRCPFFKGLTATSRFNYDSDNQPSAAAKEKEDTKFLMLPGDQFADQKNHERRMMMFEKLLQKLDVSAMMTKFVSYLPNLIVAIIRERIRISRRVIINC
jgi:hypothetical protein